MVERNYFFQGETEACPKELCQICWRQLLDLLRYSPSFMVSPNSTPPLQASLTTEAPERPTGELQYTWL